MLLLELIHKDYEGTWITPICISTDKEKLMQRAINERTKQINSHADTEDLFTLGELEEKIYTLIEHAKGDGYYALDNQNFQNYKDLTEYIIVKMTPLFIKSGVETMYIRKILNYGFYESLRFNIRDIEEI